MAPAPRPSRPSFVKRGVDDIKRGWGKFFLVFLGEILNELECAAASPITVGISLDAI
jgi:hypothetical protein